MCSLECFHLCAQELDSYSFNPHKWLLTNFDCCALWTADAGAVKEALSLTPVFLQVRTLFVLTFIGICNPLVCLCVGVHVCCWEVVPDACVQASLFCHQAPFSLPRLFCLNIAFLVIKCCILTMVACEGCWFVRIKDGPSESTVSSFISVCIPFCVDGQVQLVNAGIR